MFNVYQKSFKEGFVVFVVLLHSSQLPDQKEGLLDSLHFKFFQISVEGGGWVIGNQFFQNSKLFNLSKGQETFGLFLQFGTFFLWLPLVDNENSSDALETNIVIVISKPGPNPNLPAWAKASTVFVCLTHQG